MHPPSLQRNAHAMLLSLTPLHADGIWSPANDACAQSMHLRPCSLLGRRRRHLSLTCINEPHQSCNFLSAPSLRRKKAASVFRSPNHHVTRFHYIRALRIAFRVEAILSRIITQQPPSLKKIGVQRRALNTCSTAITAK